MTLPRFPWEFSGGFVSGRGGRTGIDLLQTFSAALTPHASACHQFGQRPRRSKADPAHGGKRFPVYVPLVLPRTPKAHEPATSSTQHPGSGQSCIQDSGRNHHDGAGDLFDSPEWQPYLDPNRRPPSRGRELHRCHANPSRGRGISLARLEAFRDIRQANRPGTCLPAKARGVRQHEAARFPPARTGGGVFP